MKTHVNLLPGSCLIRAEHRRQFRFWGLVWLVFSVSLTVVHLSYANYVRQIGRSVEELERHTEPLRSIQEAIQKLQERTKAIQDENRDYAILEQSDLPLALLQVLSTACRSVEHQVLLDKIHAENLSPASSTVKEGAPRNSQPLILSGTAFGSSSLAMFVTALKSDGLFQSVELESTQSGIKTNMDVRTFIIRCHW